MDINIYLGDSIDGLDKQRSESIDCMVTSPPYKDCDGYTESLMRHVFQAAFYTMKQGSLLFVNFGHLAEDKMRPFKVAMLVEECGFDLQETFVWLKNHIRPIQGNKRVNNLTEFVFMFSKGEMPIIDRQSVGVPYVDQSNAKRYNAGGMKCAGNVIVTDDEDVKFDSSNFHANRKFVVNETTFDIIDTAEKAYLLGFLWADGYLNQKNGRLQVGLSSHDSQHLVKIRTLLGSNHPIRIRDYFAFGKPRQNCVLNITSRHLANGLLKAGFGDKKIPIGIPTDLESHFIRGVFDGDGSVGLHQSGPLMYFMGESELLEWIRISIQKHTNEKIPGKIVQIGQIHKLQIAGKKVEPITYWLYQNSTVFLERKASKFSNILSGDLVWWIPYDTIQSSEDKLHNDRFPVELPTKCLKLAGIKPGQLVCDPFTGSGTTALACKQLGLNFVGWEINQQHYDTAIKRVL